MKTLSQISEAVYWLERLLLARPVHWTDVCEHLRKIRQDLEPHITSPTHDKPGEGIEQKEGTKP